MRTPEKIDLTGITYRTGPQTVQLALLPGKLLAGARNPRWDADTFTLHYTTPAPIPQDKLDAYDAQLAAIDSQQKTVQTLRAEINNVKDEIDNKQMAGDSADDLQTQLDDLQPQLDKALAAEQTLQADLETILPDLPDLQHTMPIPQDYLDAPKFPHPILPVPESIVTLKLRLALIEMDLDLDQLITQIPDPKLQAQARVAITNAEHVLRYSPLVGVIAKIAKLDDSGLDDLFLAAQKIDLSSL